MTKEWIIDVLSDLRRYAAEEGLTVTAEALEDASLIALAEIQSVQGHDGKVIVLRHAAGAGKAGHIASGSGIA